MPSVYLVCEADAVLPPPLQLRTAEKAESEVVQCGAGYRVRLSMPEEVVGVVRRAAEETFGYGAGERRKVGWISAQLKFIFNLQRESQLLIQLSLMF